MTTVILLSVLMWAQTPAGREASPPAPVQMASDDYVVGPQDVLNLTVFNDDSLSRPALVVDTDGTIDCPYVGRQKVTGMTTTDRSRSCCGGSSACGETRRGRSLAAT